MTTPGPQQPDPAEAFSGQAAAPDEPPGSGTTPEDMSPGAAHGEAPSRRNAALVAAGIFASRLSGLAREKGIGFFIGAGPTLDAFTAALRIPNLLQNLLGEGVLSASFIPVHSRLLSEGREEEAGRVAGAVAGLLTLVAGSLVVLGVLFARPLATVFAPGFTGARFELTVTLIRIVTPGIGFLVLSAWCLGVLNSHRRFFLSYVAPVLWNAAMIAALVAAALLGADGVGLVTALAWGTVVGGAMQLGVQLPTVLRLSRGLRLSVSTRRHGVRQVLRAFGPVVLGRGVVQVSSLIDLLLASFLATGALGYLRFSQVLYLLPVSLFGMSVAAAELPELSAAGTPRGRGAVSARLDAGLARIAFFVVPTMAVYLALGDVVVAALFRGGEFGGTDTLVVWIVLAGYSLGLLASTASRLLQSALYGSGDTRTPAKVASVRVAVSALVGIGLMFSLDRVTVAAGALAVVGEVPTLAPVPEVLRSGTVDAAARLGAAGLALGAAAGAWLEVALLRRAVVRHLAPVRLAGGRLGRLAVAGILAIAVGSVLRLPAADLAAVPAAALILAASGSVYLATAAMLGIDEARELLSAASRRIRGR